MSRVRAVKRNQIVVYQGEAVSSVCRVVDGMVRAYSILSTGNEVLVALFGKGDYFPAGSLFDTTPVALFYYETMTDCTLEFLDPQTAAGGLVRSEHEQAKNARRYIGALLHVNALGQPTASERIMHTLRYLTTRFGVTLPNKRFVRIDVKLTQHDIARLCNVSRETASIELAKLRKDNIIVQKSKMYTVNIPLLNKRIGDDGLGGIDTL
ncbi:hypothetical protein CR970_00600 [Candidatus Saccharibacteria bacterium]|nr:MAG: hypothetical protein CR970_00600 [Candidatus Saccharibacteria bacterium]